MATLKEHIYSVRNLIEKGSPSDDSRYSERLISRLLKDARSQLIKDKLNKYKAVSPLSYQTVCIELELTTYHDCSCIPADLGCKILKSKCKVPRDLVSRWGSTLAVYFPSGKIIDMSSITQNDLTKFSVSNKKPSAAYFIENQHLYVLNRTDLKVVLLSAIWEDPEEIKNFCTCNNGEITEDPCYDPINDDFPIDAELSRPMRMMVIQEIAPTVNFPQDDLNNAKNVEGRNDKEN